MQQRRKSSVPKKQRGYYSAKKKHHNLKAQLVADQKTDKIICTDFAKGSVHDFKLFKKSKVRFPQKALLLGDSGYQGIQEIHENSLTPKKASKLKPLSTSDKKENADISRVRVKVENILTFIKRFKIFSTRYRNRAKRFGLRFNLFAAIYNFEIDLK